MIPWKNALIALAFVLLSAVVYTRAELSAQEKYTKQVLQYQEQLDKKLQELQDFSKAIVVQNEIAAKTTAENIAKIVSDSKKKPLVVVENGKCYPSESFLDSYDSVINRANSK